MDSLHSGTIEKIEQSISLRPTWIARKIDGKLSRYINAVWDEPARKREDRMYYLCGSREMLYRSALAHIL
jgi:hypothetical protein